MTTGNFTVGTGQRFSVLQNGNVGVGIANPTSKFQIGTVFNVNAAGLTSTQGLTSNGNITLTSGNITSVGLNTYSVSNGDEGARIELYSKNALNGTDDRRGNLTFITRLDNNCKGDMVFGTQNGNDYLTNLKINGNGKVEIGVDRNSTLKNELQQDYKLFVGGGVLAEEVTVKMKTAWPDYVFEPDYQLPTLSETEMFIEKNKHLPNTPSAKEVETNGANVNTLLKAQQEHIERLYLYIIEMDKKIKALEAK